MKSSIELELPAGLLDQLGQEKLRALLQEHVAYLSFQQIEGKIQLQMKASGIDWVNEFSQARKEAWEAHKASYFSS
jgi:hypothetical protein